jgi:hypothetical protein
MRGYPNIPNPTGNNTKQVIDALADMLGNISGQQQQPIDQLGSSAALTDCVNKINEVIARLQGQNQSTVSSSSSSSSTTSTTSTTSTDLTNNTSASSDLTLLVGQGAYVDFSSATSVPLHIATGDNQLYELTIAASGNTGSTGNTLLLPNNSSSYTSQMYTAFNTLGSYANAYLYGVLLGYYMDMRFAKAFISTKTIAKAWKVSAYGASGTSSSYYIDGSGSWLASASTFTPVDTSTVWSSLGTISFPVAATGRAIIKRVA